MSVVYILYTSFSNPLPKKHYAQYLKILPLNLQEKNFGYVRWQDKHLHLFGKLMLIKGLRLFGYNMASLENLKYNEYNRPYLDGDIDFNISHSGEYVFCAIAKNLKLGIDIEEIRDINFSDFNGIMSKEQWDFIFSSENCLKAFYKYWTAKESIIKADGRGLSISLENIHIKKDYGFYENNQWFLKELNIAKKYCACLATDKKNIMIDMRSINFDNKN